MCCATEASTVWWKHRIYPCACTKQKARLFRGRLDPLVRVHMFTRQKARLLSGEARAPCVHQAKARLPRRNAGATRVVVRGCVCVFGGG